MTPLENILFVASLDQDNSHALHRAVALAESNQATLTLALALCIPPGYKLLLRTHVGFKNLMESEIERSRKILEKKRDELQKSTKVEIRTEVFTGKVDVEIVQRVIHSNFDLVVKSSESSEGPKRALLLFGTADINLMRYCPCPVLIVKPTWTGKFKSIIAAVDRDDEAPENHSLNLRILELSAWMAITDSSELHILHCWRLPFESLLRSRRSVFTEEEVNLMEQDEKQARENWLQGLISEFSEKHPREMEFVEPLLHTLKGHPSRKVPDLAREINADLIVMGTVGRVGVQGLLMGNTSETILQQVECSGLTVKPPGFSSSITV